MKKIFVGLSGGVDSTVAAALLKKEGHEVFGCFIKIWQPEFIECTWREDRLDAMRVCAALGIPFCEVDLSEEYKKEVVDSMLADYSRGITPNPDVLCNTTIKFGHFLKWALREGAEKVATGHHARLRQGFDGQARVELLRGIDKNKDQSYFLWQLGQDDLQKTLFPVGNFNKEKVRSLAKKFGLPNADKPDSQGLCFVGDVSMEDFLARFILLTSGPVLDTAGNTIGEHRGAALYTVGQRHGFTVTHPSPVGPYYVVSTDPDRDTVTVSADRSKTFRSHAKLENFNWIEKMPDTSFEAFVQARYRETPARARVANMNTHLSVSFAEPHLVSPGQSLVVYRGEQCLGGGIIASASVR